MEGVIITAHACDRWRLRIDPACTGHEEARRRIAELLRNATHDRDMGDGVQQFRARASRQDRRAGPGRIRLRVGPDHAGRLAVLTVLTVLPEHDGWRPRR